MVTMTQFLVTKVRDTRISGNCRRVPLLLMAALFSTALVIADDPIVIGSRRELFVDRLLIDRMDGVELRLHHPVRATRPKSALPIAHYITVIKDQDENGDLFRAYWRGKDPSYSTDASSADASSADASSGDSGQVVRYAESRDGHEWDFPQLGLHEVGGTGKNNVVLAKLPSLLHNFSPLLDSRPGVSPDERFKALAGHPGPGDKRGKAKPGMGLFAFVSADGIHWTKREEVIPYQPQWRHAFDSQNLTLEDCPPIYADEIERSVDWRGNANLSTVAGQPIQPRRFTQGIVQSVNGQSRSLKSCGLTIWQSEH